MEEVTAAEHAAGQLGAEKLQRLARHFATTGFITLCNVVPDHGLLARLERGLDIAAAIQLLQKGPEDGWRTQRTCGPLLPRTAPWVDRSVVASPIIEQLVVHLLGGAAFIRWHGQPLPHCHYARPPATAPSPSDGEKVPPSDLTENHDCMCMC